MEESQRAQQLHLEQDAMHFIQFHTVVPNFETLRRYELKLCVSCLYLSLHFS